MIEPKSESERKIFKETLRCKRITGQLPDSDQRVPLKPDFIRLTRDQLHNNQVAFLEDQGRFSCFYNDMNQQLQRISFLDEEFLDEPDFLILPKKTKQNLKDQLAAIEANARSEIAKIEKQCKEALYRKADDAAEPMKREIEEKQKNEISAINEKLESDKKKVDEEFKPKIDEAEEKAKSLRVEVKDIENQIN